MGQHILAKLLTRPSRAIYFLISSLEIPGHTKHKKSKENSHLRGRRSKHGKVPHF